MFEHMAFKGTQTIGTKNYAEEKKAMDAIEAVYDKLDAEQDPGIRSDPKKIEALHAELKAAIDKAAGYVDENAYVRIIEENGGVGLNAGTGEDSTDYFYSLPANRMELWFPLESQRFRDPIYREFYKERDVVRDKRIALAAMAQSSFPGSKYPNVFLLYEVPSVGHTVEENEKACYEVLERPKTEKVDDETLNRVKTKIRASVIRGLDSNPGMAGQLTFYCVNYGDWRKLFTGIEDIHKVTAEDVHRVARRYFTNESRTVAWTSRPQTAAQGAGK
jgi:predicted Zn-dependent peptidase